MGVISLLELMPISTFVRQFSGKSAVKFRVLTEKEKDDIITLDN